MIKKCIVCNIEFQDLTKSHCQKLCLNKECKLKYNRSRDKKYYHSNLLYRHKARQYSKKYRLLHKNKISSYLSVYRFHNKLKISSYPKKFKRFKDAKEYNQYWRAKNLYYEQLSDKIKWRFKTTLPINIIRKDYTKLKKIFIEESLNK